VLQPSIKAEAFIKALFNSYINSLLIISQKVFLYYERRKSFIFFLSDPQGAKSSPPHVPPAGFFNLLGTGPSPFPSIKGMVFLFDGPKLTGVKKACSYFLPRIFTEREK